MNRTNPDYHDLITCRDLVEAVTAYLEGALSPAERARVAAHLAVCAQCVAYVEEMETTIRMARRLRDRAIATGTEPALLRIFHDWRKDRPSR